MTQPPSAAPDIPLEYGTFSNRMMATIMDLGVLYMIALPLVDIIVDRFLPPLDITPLEVLFNSQLLQTDPPRFFNLLMQLAKQQHLIERVVVGNLLQVFFLALYILPFWFHFSATPGKMLFRLEIHDATTNLPMTRRQSVVRFFGYIVSALPFSLGFIWALFNRRGRGFHDLIAGTVVIVRPKSTRE